MKTLKIEELSKNFGSTEVLKKINLEIDEGNFLVLLGPSGCGKSTLLNIIAGLETINEGDVFIDDYNVSKVEPKDRNIAMVFQSYALYPSMNVKENMIFGLKQAKTSKEKIQEQLEKVSKFLQVDQLLERKPSQLSGGQRQRVAIGRALVREPRIFLFDEPLSNLDAKLRVEMRREIKKLHQQLKTTVVYVTHDQTEAMSLGTNIAIMNHGVIQQNDTPEKIYNKPSNTFVADFIGSPSMNLVKGILKGNPGDLLFTVSESNLEIPIKDSLNYFSKVPKKVLTASKNLKSNSLIQISLGFKTNTKIPYTAIYFPNKDFLFHRASFPHNFSKYCVPKNHILINFEITVNKGDGIYEKNDNFLFKYSK